MTYVQERIAGAVTLINCPAPPITAVKLNLTLEELRQKRIDAFTARQQEQGTAAPPLGGLTGGSGRALNGAPTCPL